MNRDPAVRIAELTAQEMDADHVSVPADRYGPRPGERAPRPEDAAIAECVVVLFLIIFGLIIVQAIYG